MKVIAVVFGLLVLLALGSATYNTLVGNPRVVADLQTNPQGERAQKAMLLYFPDGKVLPVNYLMEGNQVFAGSDFGWWRAFESGNVPVSVMIKGETYEGTARVELEDKIYIEDIFSRLRPTTPDFLTHWGKLVIIDLAPRARLGEPEEDQ